MNRLQELQEWCLSQCNGIWEHTYGVSIGTLDNPGWSLEIDLAETSLKGIFFKERSCGISETSEPSGNNWFSCKVEKNKFLAFSGPSNLDEIIGIFLAWAKTYV
jgi:hypothetical protein